MQRVELIEYVADMAGQLARLCQDHLPTVVRLLGIAAELAREELPRNR